jgi:hypothetical protein
VTAVTAARETDAQWAARTALTHYREARDLGRTPFAASHDVRGAFARYLADCVVDAHGLRSTDLAVLQYRAARAVHDEVCRRADIPNPDRKFTDLTTREQYWHTGRIGGPR